MNIKKLTGLGSILTIAASAFAFSALTSSDASATHWRGGNISWTPTANANEIQFNVTSYWRKTFFTTSADPTGESYNVSAFQFGDGASVTLNSTITNFNNSADWIKTEATLTHTYSSGTTFTASLQNCCRVGITENNEFGWFRVETDLELDGSSSADESSSSPIFLVPAGAGTTFNPFTTTDPDGGAFTYALATSDEAAGSGNPFDQPTGMTIDSNTGEVSWDTVAAGADVGELWSVSYVVTDNTGNTTPLDILLEICTPGTAGCGNFQGGENDIPEPSSMAAISVGLIGLAFIARRRRRLS